jgi:hypothetical protein
VSTDHTAETPNGNPVAVPIPVAPVVVWVIVGKTVWTHIDGDKVPAVTVFSGVIVIIPVALPPQPPVNGIK